MVAPASAVVEIVHWSKPCWLKGWSPGRKVMVLWTIFRAVETPVPTVYPIPSHTQKCWVIDLTDLPPSTKSRIPPLKCQKCQKFQITCPVVNLLVDTIKINFTTNFWSKDLLWCPKNDCQEQQMNIFQPLLDCINMPLRGGVTYLEVNLKI